MPMPKNELPKTTLACRVERWKVELLRDHAAEKGIKLQQVVIPWIDRRVLEIRRRRGLTEAEAIARFGGPK